MYMYTRWVRLKHNLLVSHNDIYIYIYRTLAKEGPWAVHLTLGQDWGMGQYSRYQYHVYTRKSAQVSYPC